MSDQKKKQGRKPVPFVVRNDRLRALIDSVDSRQEMADALMCNVSTINKHYNNENPIDIDFLVKYAKYFHVPTDYLLGFSESKTYDPSRRNVLDFFPGMTEKALDGLSSVFESSSDIFYFKSQPEIIELSNMFFASLQMPKDIVKSDYNPIPCDMASDFVCCVLAQALYKYLSSNIDSDKKDFPEKLRIIDYQQDLCSMLKYRLFEEMIGTIDLFSNELLSSGAFEQLSNKNNSNTIFRKWDVRDQFRYNAIFQQNDN